MLARFFLKKTIRLGVSLLLFTFALYGLLSLSTGDPALSVLRKLGVQAISPEVLLETRTKLGIEGNFFQQYFNWLGNVIQGDLGQSFMTNQPVKTLLMEKLGVTVQILGTSFLIAVPVSLVFGGLIGNTKIISWLKQVLSVVLSFPIYWIAIVAIFIFGVQLHWVPFVGSGSSRHFILPIAVLCFSEGTYLTKMVSDLITPIAKNERQRIAKFRGIKWYYRFYYQLNELFVPLISLYGKSLIHLFGGSVMLEIIFSISGLGKLLMDSISSRDYPVIQGITLIIALGTFLLTYMMDLSIQLVDSRIHMNQEGRL